MTYTLTTTTDEPFDEAVAITTDALQKEGFGVLCDIDVRETLKQKLDIDYRQYRILGACNPQLAHEGLTEEPELGALLPCNVIVYESDEGVTVSAVDPRRLVGVTDNPALDTIGDDVYERFERVLQTVGEEVTVDD
jgi:uncharacterized protein (DUF302 family)